MPLLLLLLALAFASCTQAPAPAPGPQVALPAVQEDPEHLTVARRLLRAIDPGKTEYRHRPSTVVFDPGKEECRTDCSGFITAVWQRAYGLTDDDIRTWLRSRRPVARTYHAAILRGDRFVQVKKVTDWRPGDLIAIRYPRGTDDTGHTMIIDARPRERDQGEPLVDGTTQYEVEVIDVTGSAHSRDSRSLKGNHASPGLGRGTIRVYAAPDGAVAGHTWGLGSRSVYRPQNERDLVVGRYVAHDPAR